MEQISLDSPYAQGIAHVAFWNGRILTAEDMRAEQLANQLGRARLGRAVGPGVASGLVARAGSTPATVEVTAGLAVDALGQAVELPVDVEVSLVVPPATAGGDGVFTVCDPVASDAPTGTGLYLLVLRPASESRSSVAGVPAAGNGVASECGPRYTVDGVSFRLVGVDAVALAEDAGHDADDRDVLGSLGSVVEHRLARNVVAHLFLATRAWAALLADPFAADPGQVDRGALAALRADVLLPCEVPVAVVSWSFAGVGFVDVWPARRPCTLPTSHTAVGSLAGPQREVLARATYSQFQDHLATLAGELSEAGRAAFALPDRFRYLPAAGLVPLAGPAHPGFAADAVLGDLVVRGPVGIPATRVGAILDESFHHRPIDVSSGEVVFAYAVDGSGSGSPDYLVFCTSRMPFLGEDLVIDAVFPAGALHLRQRIDIRGRGFGFTRGHARVRFDTTPAAPLPGSSDVRLLVEVPGTLDVDPEGTEVTLEVSNGEDSDSVPVVVGHREQPVLGNLHLSWESVDPETPQRGEPATIRYALRSALNQRADVDVDLDGSPEELMQAAALVDAAGAPLDGPVTMDPGDVLAIVVRVDPVPDVDSFTVALGAAVGDLTAADTRTFRPGSPTTPADPAITLLVDHDPDVQRGTVRMSGTTIRMSPDAIADIEILVRVTEPGDYDVRVEPTDLEGAWRTVLSEPPDGRWERIPPAEFDVDGEAFREARMTVGRFGAPPPPSATVSFVVQRPGRSDEARATFTIEPL